MFYLPGKRSHSPIRSSNGLLQGRVVDEYDTSELRSLLAHPDRLFDATGTEILKHDGRSTVARLRIGGVEAVVKQNHAVSLAKGLKRAFAPSRAARAWYAAHTMEALDIPTAAPIAYVERRYGCFRGRSWLVLENLAGIDARTYLSDTRIPLAERKRIIDEIVTICARLHRARMTHGDNRPENFLIVDGVPHIIDLDVAMIHPRWSPVRARYMRRDIEGLLAPWRRQPEIVAALHAALERHRLGTA